MKSTKKKKKSDLRLEIRGNAIGSLKSSEPRTKGKGREGDDTWETKNNSSVGSLTKSCWRRFGESPQWGNKCVSND